MPSPPFRNWASGFGLEITWFWAKNGTKFEYFLLKFWERLKKFFKGAFFCRSPEKFLKDLFFRDRLKKSFWRPFVILESTCADVLVPWPWPRAFLPLTWPRESLFLEGLFLALASSLVSDSSSGYNIHIVFLYIWAKKNFGVDKTLQNSV